MKKALSALIYLYATTALVALMIIAFFTLGKVEPESGSKPSLSSTSNSPLNPATTTSGLMAVTTGETAGTAVVPVASIEDVKRIPIYPGAITDTYINC